MKAKLNAESLAAQEQGSEIYDDPKSFSESTTSDSYNESKGKWFSAEELRKVGSDQVGLIGIALKTVFQIISDKGHQMQYPKAKTATTRVR